VCVYKVVGHACLLQVFSQVLERSQGGSCAAVQRGWFKGRRLLTGAPRPRRYLGQINPTDFFTRLLAGIAYTRLAPASFYKDPSGPNRHFDGMCAARARLRDCRPACLWRACSRGVRLLLVCLSL